MPFLPRLIYPLPDEQAKNELFVQKQLSSLV